MEISELKSVALAIAPEIDGRVSLHLAENGTPFPPGAAAVSAYDPPPWIRAKGLHGPCIVFRNREWATLESLIHELAHILPLSAEEPIEPPKPLFADVSKYVCAWSADDPPELEKASHNMGFVRRSLHLAFRCEVRLGLGVDIDDAFHACGCSNRTADEYRRALGNEPLESIGLSFLEIARTDPPPQFLRLFHNAAFVSSGRRLTPVSVPG